MSDQLSSLREFVEPWYQSLARPKEAQEELTRKLVLSYAKTEYGKRYNAEKVKTVKDFQVSFPIVRYHDLQPYIKEVMSGRYSAILAEPVVRWVMTRGTTGISKLMPATRTHLSQILSVGARGIINFALKNDPKVLQEEVLNLNFPSEVGVTNTQGVAISYGYSSGTYAKFNPELGPARLVPRQEELDSLGGGVKNKDWENRFELVYQRAKEREIGSLMGVAPVITAFARYLKRKHNTLPKDLWRLRAILCTSVTKIQTNYVPYLRRLYGEVPVVELYTATEGVFAQQLDEKPYVCPNYDVYLFEVVTGSGVKMLHELREGEWGRLIISSVLFPRYDIGDLVEAMGKGYFRIFGRAKTLTVIEHVLFNIFTGRIFRV
jgi:hypothetical protein